jgi:hypothetical protein
MAVLKSISTSELCKFGQRVNPIKLKKDLRAHDFLNSRRPWRSRRPWTDGTNSCGRAHDLGTRGNQKLSTLETVGIDFYGGNEEETEQRAGFRFGLKKKKNPSPDSEKGESGVLKVDNLLHQYLRTRCHRAPHPPRHIQMRRPRKLAEFGNDWTVKPSTHTQVSREHFFVRIWANTYFIKISLSEAIT